MITGIKSKVLTSIVYSMHKLLDAAGNVIGQSITGMSDNTVYESYYDGKTLFSGVGKNKLLITGTTTILEKMTNTRSTWTPTPIDQDLGVSLISDIDLSLDNLKNEVLIGFVVGTGGCGDTRNSIVDVKRHHKNVVGQVPFRVLDLSKVPDLTGAERAQYFLRKQVGDIVYYYGKLATGKTIKTLFANSVEVPADVHTQNNPGEIFNYTEYVLDVSTKDIREYSIMMEGSTLNARFNSIGIVTGYPVVLPDGNTEYRNVRVNGVLNTDNKALKDAAATATYRYQYRMK